MRSLVLAMTNSNVAVRHPRLVSNHQHNPPDCVEADVPTVEVAASRR